MKLAFSGDLKGLEQGIAICGGELGFETTAEGLPVRLERRPGNIRIVMDGKQAAIGFQETIHFFRALGLFIEALRNQDSFAISEEPQFTMNGAMFDLSRNAVLKIDRIKELLRKMALMGLNVMMLYTEDIYTIADEPYFGYMRGRYSREELAECDEYAGSFGIEMIPCIQTLGHLKQYLKWEAAADLRDTGEILLAGEEKTYQLIEKMIRSASAPYRSKRIHIGMDEAYGAGLGKYLTIHGFRNRYDVMNEHLQKVVAITSQYGLKPMIWSDMYFSLGSKTGNYYDPDAVVPDAAARDIPTEVQLVYWDYYHQEEGFYRNFIKRHQNLGKNPVFAGGIWTWTGMGTNYGRTIATTNAALNACKKEGVPEVFATLWMDDGAENNFFTALLGLQLFAEHGYADRLDSEKLKRRVEFCTGIAYDAFRDLGYLDEIPGCPSGNPESCNPSKYLLWQDLLMGLFDRHTGSRGVTEHYRKLRERMHHHCRQNGQAERIFGVAEELSTVLEIKHDMGIRIKNAYDQKDLPTLKRMVEEQLPELSRRVAALRETHREQWYDTYKPFGWEVLNIRYGGLLAAIDNAAKRLRDYLDGRVDRLEELEAERLFFDGDNRTEAGRLVNCSQYQRIVTAGTLSF